MTEHPDPLTPEECDLRDYPWMPLDVLRLRDSTIAAVENAEAFRCAVLLWCASWHQIPAASLPDDEGQLARLAGYGRDLKAFRSARAGDAMRGWIKCSDGRLYHPVVAEKANESWNAKIAQKARTEAARAALAKRRSAAAKVDPQTPPQTQQQPQATDNVTDIAADAATVSVTMTATGSTVQDKTRQDIKRKEPPSLRSGTPCVAASRGSRLTDDWEPDRPFALGLGLDPETVLAGFRDYWRSAAGAKGRKADWQATWRNWCRKEAERRPLARASPPSRQAESAEKLRRYMADIAEKEAETEPLMLQ